MTPYTIWSPKMKVANERKKKEENEEALKIVFSYQVSRKSGESLGAF